MPPVIPDSPSPRLQVVLKYFEYFASDVEAFANILSEDLLHQSLPASLEMPDWNKEELLMQVLGLNGTLRNFAFAINDIIEGSEKIVINMTTSATSISGEPWSNQCFIVFRLKTDDAGELKIYEIRAFVDSTYIREFFPAEFARAKKLGLRVTL